MRRPTRITIYLFLLLCGILMTGCGGPSQEPEEPAEELAPVNSGGGLPPPPKTTIEPDGEAGTVMWTDDGSRAGHRGDKINPKHYKRKIDDVFACSTQAKCKDKTCTEYAELQLDGGATIRMKIVNCAGGSGLRCIDWHLNGTELGEDTGASPAKVFPEAFKAQPDQDWKMYCDGEQVYYVEIDWKGGGPGDPTE